MSKTTNPTNTNDIDDEEYDEFEESFPNIIDDDGDINRNNNDTLSYQNQLQTSAFSEKINRLQEQIRTAQHIRESLSADIDRQTKILSKFQEQKEKDAMKIPIYDPYNEILQAEQESIDRANRKFDAKITNDNNNNNINLIKDGIINDKKKHTRAELARVLGKTTNQSRISQRKFIKKNVWHD